MFIDKHQFDFVARLEAGWRAIRDECVALPQDAFEPWVQRQMYGGGWDVYGFYAFGQRIDAALRECPRTAAVLSCIPGLTTAGFSRLNAGAQIRAHEGWVTTVFRGHLGLIVPDNCALRVGEETRQWHEGECLIFDDTTEHEAWNHSTEMRTVLLFDFLRPGCEQAEADTPPLEVEEFVSSRLRSSGSIRVHRGKTIS
jgi:aspartyl/asparaginyl beta-hydroxylase (cupin superfamily)